MIKSSITKAEARFTATQKKDKKLLTEREKSRKENADKLARLRALRLDKEEAELRQKAKGVTAKAATDTPVENPVETPDENPVDTTVDETAAAQELPQAHRRQS